ncbi:MAG TPA: hypothetical protein VEH31_05885 [Streptosporangiaceae bacterium]|nr:hypothetical protein [Streptosporangiaceae bacterium]
MGKGSSGPGPVPPAGAGDGEATQTFMGHDRPGPPPHPPTEVARPYPATEAVPPPPPAEFVSYGPGVPAPRPGDRRGLTAEQVWRSGRPPAPARRGPRLRQLLGWGLTVILLAASGVVLYLRFHHPPFHVTGVAISQRTRTGCGVDVTGRITTNGSAGTVSYQWLFQPGRQQPQPLSQSVTAGQHAVYVTAALEGSGHGSASKTATLQILGPDPRSVSATVVVTC